MVHGLVHVPGALVGGVDLFPQVGVADADGGRVQDGVLAGAALALLLLKNKLNSTLS